MPPLLNAVHRRRPLGLGDNRQRIPPDLCLVLIDRFRDPTPGLQPIVPLHVGENATLMRIACQERIQHRPELPTNLDKVSGNIDHPDVLGRRRHMGRDRLDLSLDPIQERVNLGQATCDVIAGRLKP